jgi:hypothetical protein
MQRITRVERACDAGPVGKIGREMAKIRQNYSATIENADGFKMRRIIDNFERRSSRRTHFSESFFYTEAREDGERHEFRNGFDLQLVHNARAAVFHRARAHSQLGGNVFVGFSL